MSTYWFVLEGPICSTPVKDVGLKPGKIHMKTSRSIAFAAVLAGALALVTELLSFITDRQSSSKKGGFSKC